MTPARPGSDDPASIESEVPEADALEQQEPARHGDDDTDDEERIAPSGPTIRPDVPEADAIEQSIPAPVEDEELELD